MPADDQRKQQTQSANRTGLLTDEELGSLLKILRYHVWWTKKGLSALARPRDVEASTLTGGSQVLKDIEVLAWRDGGAIGGREGLDGILDSHFASWLEHPTDLDGGVIVAHEGEG